MNIKQADDAYIKASNQVRKASRKYDRYKAFFGVWHRSTRKAWDELTAAWANSDQAWQNNTEAHRAHMDQQMARIAELRVSAWR